MPFDLEVEFSGLCLFVVHTSGEQVAILMPDARRRDDQDPGHHVDGDEAKAHVGYVQFNLANLADLAGAVPAIPHGVPTPHRHPPEYEVVHRFDRQVLDFGDAFQPETMRIALNVPDFSDFAPELALRPDLFTSSPSGDVLLTRTVLRGGNLVVSKPLEPFQFPAPFGKPDHEGLFASSVKWTRRVETDTLSIGITGFGDHPQQGPVHAAFTLQPAAPGEKVTLKVANLCAENPLDWRELESREANAKDLDFKWLYRLFEPVGTTWEALLAKMPDGKLPVPHLKKPSVSGVNDCMPATTRMAF